MQPLPSPPSQSPAPPCTHHPWVPGSEPTGASSSPISWGSGEAMAVPSQTFITCGRPCLRKRSSCKLGWLKTQEVGVEGVGGVKKERSWARQQAWPRKSISNLGCVGQEERTPGGGRGGPIRRGGEGPHSHILHSCYNSPTLGSEPQRSGASERHLYSHHPQAPSCDTLLTVLQTPLLVRQPHQRYPHSRRGKRAGKSQVSGITSWETGKTRSSPTCGSAPLPAPLFPVSSLPLCLGVAPYPRSPFFLHIPAPPLLLSELSHPNTGK